jgi:hypothetical protein
MCSQSFIYIDILMSRASNNQNFASDDMRINIFEVILVRICGGTWDMNHFAIRPHLSIAGSMSMLKSQTWQWTVEGHTPYQHLVVDCVINHVNITVSVQGKSKLSPVTLNARDIEGLYNHDLFENKIASISGTTLLLNNPIVERCYIRFLISKVIH